VRRKKSSSLAFPRQIPTIIVDTIRGIVKGRPNNSFYNIISSFQKSLSTSTTPSLRCTVLLLLRRVPVARRCRRIHYTVAPLSHTIVRCFAPSLSRTTVSPSCVLSLNRSSSRSLILAHSHSLTNTDSLPLSVSLPHCLHSNR